MSEKAERLVNLTVALLEARVPKTFGELRRRLRTYDQPDGESARRMFERDKDALRSLGVPIETREVSAFSDEVGYIIDRAAYELPAVDLTADEVAALSVAVTVSGEQSARLGLTKLATLAPDPTEVGIPHERIGLATAQLERISEAVVNRRTIRFPYQRGDGGTSQRSLQPYGVASRRGRWYVVGFDEDRGDVRAFRVDRMTAAPTSVGEGGAFTIPEGFSARAHIEGPEAQPVDAVIAFHPDVAWQASGRGGVLVEERPDGWQVLAFTAVQPWRTVSWVLGFGEHAVVHSPESLRTAIIDQLTRVIDVAP